MDSNQIRYRDAGVDIDEADRAVSAIKKMARRTFTPGVLTDIGCFGASYQLSGWKKPVLVSSADGVGTKVKVAFTTGRHDTVGEDLVNHCVNDIAVQGARPLFFLDYFAIGKLDGRGRCGGRLRTRPGLRAQRLRLDRRRDRRDAGALRRGRVRPGRLHRGRGGAQRAAHRRGHPRGRRAARPALHRPAHQRLFARAQAALRNGGLRAQDAACRSLAARWPTNCSRCTAAT